MRSAILLSAVGLASALVLALVGPACTNNQTFLPERASYATDGQAPLSCVPNLDGQIDATELMPAIGLTATYLVSPPGVTRPVNLDGTTDAAGKIVWDWSTDLADDRQAMITATTLDGKWYAGSFPTGQFVTPFDAGDTVEAVYVHDTGAVRLLGLASTDPSPPEGKTLIVYQVPVAVFEFPIKPGAAWKSVGQYTNATVRGLPFAGTDTYDTKVDAVGTMILHDFTFQQAMRVRTLVTLVPVAGQTTTQRQVSYLFECFGEVARATSLPNEKTEDFTTASEIRRLGATAQ